MKFEGFPDEAFGFFKGLVENNSKEYWHEHKATYEQAVREPMLALLGELEDEFDEGRLMRPQRDTRFSKDKSPYKTYQGVTIGAGRTVGYYLQLEAEGLFHGAGFHPFDPATTKRYRGAVDGEHAGSELVKITDQLTDQGFELVGEQVKTHPRGYAEDHPRIALLRYKSLGAECRVPRSKLHGRKALTIVRDDFRALRPLVGWLTDHVDK